MVVIARFGWLWLEFLGFRRAIVRKSTYIWLQPSSDLHGRGKQCKSSKTQSLRALCVFHVGSLECVNPAAKNRTSVFKLKF